MTWGLIPFINNEKPNFFKYYNARSENLNDKNIYKPTVITKRCVVIIEGFYEWKRITSKDKQPYYIKSKTSKVLYLAGLYTKCMNLSNQELYTFTIVTGNSPSKYSDIHNRIPVFFFFIYIDYIIRK